MIFIYELYGYIFDDFLSGRVYSDKDLLENNELMRLIEKAIKCIGSSNAEDPRKVAEKINEFLNMEPTRKNIAEYVDVRYTFANSCNCGGYYKNEKLYNWLKEDDCDYRSNRFFSWFENCWTKKREYVPCRYGLDIYRG